jgi:dTDP-4-amino-4,6-dideoxygalactose transaminase
MRFSKKNLPIAEEYAARLLRLPLYGELTSREITQVVEALCEVLS